MKSLSIRAAVSNELDVIFVSPESEANTVPAYCARKLYIQYNK